MEGGSPGLALEALETLEISDLLNLLPLIEPLGQPLFLFLGTGIAKVVREANLTRAARINITRVALLLFLFELMLTLVEELTLTLEFVISASRTLLAFLPTRM